MISARDILEALDNESGARVILEALDNLAGNLNFFPTAPGERAAVGEQFAKICASEAEVKWLADRVVALVTKWPGSMLLRQIYSERFGAPRDTGISVTHSVSFPDGVPAEPGRILPAPDPHCKACHGAGFVIVETPNTSSAARCSCREHYSVITTGDETNPTRPVTPPTHQIGPTPIRGPVPDVPPVASIPRPTKQDLAKAAALFEPVAIERTVEDKRTEAQKLDLARRTIRLCLDLRDLDTGWLPAARRQLDLYPELAAEFPEVIR